MGGLQLPAEDRFLNNILVGAGECWPWAGATNRKGYGVIRVGKKTWLAHRYGYEFFVRPLGDEQLHHVCGNRLCVRPEHLEVMVASDHSRLHNGHGEVKNQFGVWPVYSTDEERLDARRAMARRYARERRQRSQSNPACSDRIGM